VLDERTTSISENMDLQTVYSGATIPARPVLVQGVAPMQRLLSASVVLVLATAILPVSGCDDIAKEFGYIPAKAAAPKKPTGSGPVTQGESNSASSQKLTDAEIDDMARDSGPITIVSSPAVVLSGDMRPRYIASGHIKNNEYRDLKSVRVRIIAHPKDKSDDDVLDTAEFDVEDIPAHEAKAFRREVPLLVPKDFRFEWTILSATAKPENQ
jgi:hypothetical protein